MCMNRDIDTHLSLTQIFHHVTRIEFSHWLNAVCSAGVDDTVSHLEGRLLSMHRRPRLALTDFLEFYTLATSEEARREQR